MDIINILEQLKKKGLDVVQIELLKNAYELQNQNLEQLKANNDALRESNELLKEKIKKLEEEKQEILTQHKALPKDKSYDKVSEIAKDVLRECIKTDVIEFDNETMIAGLSKYSRIQTEAALGELFRKEYITIVGISGPGYGTRYLLTQSG